MFLVELSYNKIREKIDYLDQKQAWKEGAIKTSEKNLEEDDIKVNDHLDKDRAETEKMAEEANQAMKQWQDKENELKIKDTEIKGL